MNIKSDTECAFVPSQDTLESIEAPVEGTVELTEVKAKEPWEKFSNPNVRREQEFLSKLNTSVGSTVEMSDRRYTVNRNGWTRQK